MKFLDWNRTATELQTPWVKSPAAKTSCQPRAEFEILDCALGRVAVLICEDLSNQITFGSIVQEFEIDWLFVPVMDGAQTKKRWTAKYAKRFAEDSGTSVLVTTCGALVSAHRAYLVSKGQRDPGHLCGLLAFRKPFDLAVKTFASDLAHDEVTVIRLK